MKTFKDYLKEMGGGGGGAGGGAVSAGPTNTVGSGAIAGAGQPPGSKSGEPGVDLRKRRKKVSDPRLPMGIGKRKDF
jgi:hypothetical protein